jgi:type II secretory pathway pseudopilin PulG
MLAVCHSFVLAGPFPPLANRESAQITLIVLYVLAGILAVGGIVWLVWWMRKQERRIRELRAQEAEYEHQLQEAQGLDDSEEHNANGPSEDGPLPSASREGRAAAEPQNSARANGASRRNPGGKPKTEPGNQRKRQT